MFLMILTEFSYYFEHMGTPASCKQNAGFMLGRESRGTKFGLKGLVYASYLPLHASFCRAGPSYLTSLFKGPDDLSSSL